MSSTDPLRLPLGSLSRSIASAAPIGSAVASLSFAPAQRTGRIARGHTTHKHAPEPARGLPTTRTSRIDFACLRFSNRAACVEDHAACGRTMAAEDRDESGAPEDVRRSDGIGAREQCECDHLASASRWAVANDAPTSHAGASAVHISPPPFPRIGGPPLAVRTVSRLCSAPHAPERASECDGDHSGTLSALLQYRAALMSDDSAANTRCRRSLTAAGRCVRSSACSRTRIHPRSTVE